MSVNLRGEFHSIQWGKARLDLIRNWVKNVLEVVENSHRNFN
jgi:hypothetical protein